MTVGNLPRFDIAALKRVAGAAFATVDRMRIWRMMNYSHIIDARPQPRKMLMELRNDNAQLTRYLRGAHEICERNNDVATTSLIEVWIDQTERRTWFLSEIVRDL